MNKYEKWYQQITERGKLRSKTDKTESHHIIPKCLGGSDDKENRANVTAREHFICHWLLIKIHTSGEERWKVLNALRMMRAENPGQKRYKTKITSRVYARIKEEYRKLQSIKNSGENNPMFGDKFYRSPEGKERQRNAVLGEKNGSKQAEARAKISKSKLGKKRPAFSAEWLANIKAARQGQGNGMFGKTHSNETKAKMRAKALGRKQDPDVVKRKADAIRGSKREKKLCPHCQQLISVNTYPRWHGDRCKKAKPC